MESGKIFLVALVSVVSTYAAITAWPAVKELFNPMNGSAVAASTPAVAVTPPTTPAVPASGAVLQNTPVAQAMPVRGSAQLQAASVPAFSQPRLSTIPWTNTDLKYARHSVVMRATPGGVALRAVSLNKAGLTILRGTRLMPVKYKGDWVMVQSPSAVIGWVHSMELTDQRPVTHDHYALSAE